MSKVDLIRIAKALKNKFKKEGTCYLSYCRRIDRVKTTKRICAMTFDDGPTYDSDITSTILNVLESFDAKGTFDVIGTTVGNYPDEEGKIGTPSWSGIKFDHYPKFNADKSGGAVNCPDLINRIISSGHEITNHTYSHVLFGRKNVIYSKRHTLNGFDSVYEDVSNLHTYLYDKHGYTMKFSRPPHYVDRISGGYTSYDVYAKMGYNYLAASFDGAGWLPCETEEAEINAMVEPLRATLEKDPNSLCGQIIFQKDGYNMSLRAPVKEGLRRQLALLHEYGYKVVTISELLEEAPFRDIDDNDADFEFFKELQKHRAITFSDNTLRLDKLITRGELAMLIAPKEIAVDKRIDAIKNSVALPYSVKASHPYSTAIVWAIEQGYLSSSTGNVTEIDIQHCSSLFEKVPLNLTRREVYKAYKTNKIK